MSEADPALVTDHAIVRWIERVLGIDIRGRVLEEMLGDGRAEMVQQVQTGRIRVAGTRVVLVVEGGRVITIMTIQRRKKRGKNR